MARQSFDFRRFILASVLIMIVGIALVILGAILQLLSVVITDANAPLIQLASSIYDVAEIPLFLILFFWCGMRAARGFSFDAVGAAMVTAFSYIIIAAVQLLIDVVLSLIVVSKGIPTPGFGSAEATLAASLFSGASGISGIGLSAICGVGVIVLGALINFVVGGAGALFALRKTVSQ